MSSASSSITIVSFATLVGVTPDAVAWTHSLNTSNGADAEFWTAYLNGIATPDPPVNAGKTLRVMGPAGPPVAPNLTTRLACPHWAKLKRTPVCAAPALTGGR